MKLKNKGFTLIELLAVIVLLSIIMVIAVPQILDIIDSSKKIAWESNVKLVKESLRLTKSTNTFMGTKFDINEHCLSMDKDSSTNITENLISASIADISVADTKVSCYKKIENEQTKYMIIVEPAVDINGKSTGQFIGQAPSEFEY